MRNLDPGPLELAPHPAASSSGAPLYLGEVLDALQLQAAGLVPSVLRADDEWFAGDSVRLERRVGGGSRPG